MLFDKKANNPVLAVGYLFKGLNLLTSTSLRSFILIPVLINLVLYGVALTLGYYYISDLINQFIPSWLNWLSWVLWPLFLLASLLRVSLLLQC